MYEPKKGQKIKIVTDGTLWNTRVYDASGNAVYVKEITLTMKSGKGALYGELQLTLVDFDFEMDGTISDVELSAPVIEDGRKLTNAKLTLTYEKGESSAE
jgi:hypothetical protein